MAKIDLEKFKNNAKKTLSKKETHGIFKEDGDKIQKIPLEKLGEGIAIRLFDHDLAILQASIQHSGQLEPIVVYPKEEGYEILDGRRRVRVARNMGLSHIAAEVAEVDEKEVLFLPFVLNTKSSFDLVEIVLYLRRLVKEFGFSEEEIAARTGLKVSDYKELFFDPGDDPLAAFNAHFEQLLKRYFRIVRGEINIEKNGLNVRFGVNDLSTDFRTKAALYRFIFELSSL